MTKAEQKAKLEREREREIWPAVSQFYCGDGRVLPGEIMIWIKCQRNSHSLLQGASITLNSFLHRYMHVNNMKLVTFKASFEI
jgi:hypothetical protein